MAAVDIKESNQQHDPLHHHHPASTSNISNPSTPTTVMHLEPRPFRPFKSSEEYLWAMKEDLAEWLNALYGLDVVAENFLEKLETGVTLCQHANSVRKMAIAQQQQHQLNGNNNNNNNVTFNGYRPTNNANYEAVGLTKEVVYRADVPPGTFHARDNVSNFIAWCRSLGIYDCLMFETEDLVLRKNERNFILCLLEVARRGAAVGMPVPLLVQMEHEIDREIEKEKAEEERRRRREEEKAFCCSSSSSSDGGIEEEDVEPPRQIITNDLKSLDEMVRDLVNRCSCPIQFPMIRVSEGKYRIGDTQVLIFVRILRSHVMVRVGGGWDTLEHYLDKHDPCRCRQGHRFTVGSKVMIKHSPNPAQTQMQVTYERSAEPFRIGLGSQGAGGSGSPARLRRASIPSIHGSRASLNSIGSDKERLAGEKMRRFSGDHSAAILAALSSSGGLQRSSSPAGSSGDTSKLSTCDKSSEHSDEGYQSGSRVPTFKVHKHMPQKLLCLTETGLLDSNGRDGNDLMQGYPGSSECSSVVSPESSCSLGDEPTITSQKSIVATTTPDGRRLKSNIPMKVTKATVVLSVVDGKLSRKKSQSTEVLGEQVNSAPTPASAYNLRKARRFSGDRGMITGSAGKGHMTRSRSQCSEDSELAACLGYQRPGRGSLRLPRSSNGGTFVPRSSTGGNNTWSHRQKETRPALNSDLFSGRPPRASGGSHSPSPHRRKVVTPRTSPPRSLQSSPSKHVSPLLQQVLAAAVNGSEDKLLQKMAELVQQHYGSPKLSSTSPDEMQPQPPTEMIPGENYTKYWLATSDHAPRNRHSSGTSHSLDSPEDAGADADHNLSAASQPSKIPIRVSLRKDPIPGSTRIPMPTFYNL